jgi:hypothetical protein
MQSPGSNCRQAAHEKIRQPSWPGIRITRRWVAKAKSSVMAGSHFLPKPSTWPDDIRQRPAFSGRGRHRGDPAASRPRRHRTPPELALRRSRQAWTSRQGRSGPADRTPESSVAVDGTNRPRFPMPCPGCCIWSLIFTSPFMSAAPRTREVT